MQVSLANGQPLEDSGIELVGGALKAGQISQTSLYVENGRVMVRFPSVDEQLKAADALRAALGKPYVVAMTLTPSTPAWLRGMGLKPVPLGLDLRGGVHFLFEVDMSTAIKQRLDAYSDGFQQDAARQAHPAQRLRWSARTCRSGCPTRRMPIAPRSSFATPIPTGDRAPRRRPRACCSWPG